MSHFLVDVGSGLVSDVVQQVIAEKSRRVTEKVEKMLVDIDVVLVVIIRDLPFCVGLLVLLKCFS